MHSGLGFLLKFGKSASRSLLQSSRTASAFDALPSFRRSSILIGGDIGSGNGIWPFGSIAERRNFCGGYAIEQFSDDEYECEFENHKVLLLLLLIVICFRLHLMKVGWFLRLNTNMVCLCFFFLNFFLLEFVLEFSIIGLDSIQAFVGIFSKWWKNEFCFILLSFWRIFLVWLLFWVFWFGWKVAKILRILFD